MKKIFIYLLCFIFLLSMQRNVYAVGEGNIDGGGGGMGHGTSEYYWNSGDDGVRVTIIRDSDNTAVSTPVDFTNRHPDNIQFHFGKVSKIQYRNGALLTPTTSTYLYNNPEQPLPRIVSSDGNVNIAVNAGIFLTLNRRLKIDPIAGFQPPVFDGRFFIPDRLLLEYQLAARP